MWNVKHVPVMVKEIVENLPENMNIFVDWTVWHAWHFKFLLESYKNVKFIWIDRDANMLNIAKKTIWENLNNIYLFNDSYSNLHDILWNEKVDAIFLDLWVNMQHFKEAERWFSIKKDGPLDMRFDKSQFVTAEYIIKNYKKSELERIFINYWDFKWKVLEIIISIIIKFKWKNTVELVKQLQKEWLSLKKIAVVFQVLRIEVNKELENLELFLDEFPDYLQKNWRCLIITYHSIEDRLVKNKFKELDKKWFKNLTKSVIFPTLEEIKRNKASRSAKLRILQKI